MKWEPLIIDREAAEILRKISEIADQLKEDILKIENIGLFSGKTGICLFFFYYAKLVNRAEYSDLAHDIFGNVFDEITGRDINCTLANGLSGIGWAVEHLVRHHFIQADVDEILRDVDSILHEAMLKYIKEGNYDALHGALSQGLYFLERKSNPGAGDILLELVMELDRISIKDGGHSVKWRSVLEPGKGTTGYNPSLSHGIAGIIYFLSRLKPQGDSRFVVSRLLSGAVRYLAQITQDPGTSLSYFPTWICDGVPLKNSRLAWCYGDLGIGAAIFRAGKSTGNVEWEEMALEILLHTTRRRDLIENFVADAGICHGTAGIAHIYNRLYRETGIDAFKEAARFWFGETMKMAVFDDGYGGFKAFSRRNIWRNSPGILEGAAGIGLVLISAISAIEPYWDRCLLLS